MHALWLHAFDGTAIEWRELIFEKHLTISRNLFGTTYYTLVGFHALHVFAGLILMLVILGRAAAGAYSREDHAGVEVAAYYWHFVDVVWIGLYTTIFLIK